jgi:thiamine pyrophosphate-dependent acetolactate synthase large subunit-like protein
LKNDYDGGEAILEAFRNLDVDYVISSPGSEWPSFWEAMARQKHSGMAGPTYLNCAHETIAVTIAAAYTNITGRMQAVLLHAGAGLLQGSMAVGAARAMETPMLVMSGEALGYGEADFDPGSQWYRNLSVVGGPQRLLEPVVKWAQGNPAPETLYQTIVRAGEMAQRTPKGPTYVCVAMETMLHEWARPDELRKVPPAPKSQPQAADIDKVAALLAQAKCPVISVENAGPDREAFDALVELADLMAIPVVEGAGAFFANFPKSHDLYLGTNINELLNEIDVALLIESRAPWYPPSNAPKNARKNAAIVAISENPLKTHMAYQTMEAGHYLEGNVALTLRQLTQALRKLDRDADMLAQRRVRWQAAHRKWHDGLRAAEEKAVTAAAITVPLVAKVLREVMPADTIYVDETIVHAGAIREHTMWDEPLGFFRAPSGLGQGLGYALGVKLAAPKRPVVMTIGDGTFMYNPVVPAISFADEYAMPLLILVFNNSKYASMQYFHDKFYPAGTSIATKDYYGVNIKGPSYEEAAAMVGGYAKRVEHPAELKGALQAALASIKAGKTAILNLIMPDPGNLR